MAFILKYINQIISPEAVESKLIRSKMIFDPACIPCAVKQAFSSAKLFSGDKEVQLKIMKDVCAEVENINGQFTGPVFSHKIQTICEKYSGIKDPYKNIKYQNLKIAEKYIPYLKVMIENSMDRLETSVRAAILGNIIDLGANPDFNIEDEINKIASNNIELSSFEKFKTDVQKARSILYIGDNFEEALFDKLLIEELKPDKVVYAVRSEPILNDVTLQDAMYLGIDKICKIVESGSKIAGTDLVQCSDEFIELFNTSDVVISKGQGNYETLMDEKRDIYFLFKVKCEVIERKSGYKMGTSVLQLNNI